MTARTVLDAGDGAITIHGAPLSVRLAALYLLRRRPALPVHLVLDPAEDWLGEGQVVLLDGGNAVWRTMLAPLMTREWPGFLTMGAEGRCEHEEPIGLIDPLQCEAELAAFAGRLLSDPPGDAEILHVPPLGEPMRPSRVLDAGTAHVLDRPVLYEAGSIGSEFAQYLPLGGGSTMVRAFARGGHRDPVAELFGTQYAFMALLGATDS